MFLTTIAITDTDTVIITATTTAATTSTTRASIVIPVRVEAGSVAFPAAATTSTTVRAEFWGWCLRGAVGAQPVFDYR
jgi:hypothetical protein